MRNSFVFYSSFYDGIKELPKGAQLEVYNAICKYALLGEVDELSATAKAMFSVMRPLLDKAQSRYDANVENGKKGGRPRKENPMETQKNPTITQAKPNETQQKPNANLNDNDNVNDNVNDNDNVIKADKPPRTHFTKPSLEDVLAYCQERGNGVDAERFIDYYNANGWRVGKNAMKDWKAAVRTWEKNGFGVSAAERKPKVPMGGGGLHDSDYEAIRRMLQEE